MNDDMQELSEDEAATVTGGSEFSEWLGFMVGYCASAIVDAFTTSDGPVTK